MKFKELAIQNFGVYEGVHEFSLRTNSQGSDKGQNLIVVKGPNGSGKSTFFTAISLVLFGRQTLGNKVSQREYEEFLLSRFHKARFAGNTVKTENASVSLALEYVESGRRNEINIKRTWTRNENSVSETLEILKNDSPPEVQEVDYDTWLNDLFPPGLKTILCFDAEDMNALVRAKNDEELKKVVKHLLGLHLVEQLEDDLQYYLRQKGGGTRYDSLRDDITEQQQAVDKINSKLKEKKDQQEKLRDKEKEINSDLNRFERELSSEGGDYAARRPIIKERLEQLEEEIEKDEDKLRDLCTELLPFTLAPSLSNKLNSRLESELELHRKQITSEFLQDKIGELSESLDNSSLWNELEVEQKQSEKIIQHLKELLESEIDENDHSSSLVHELAENDVLKLQRWIQEAQKSVPQLALHISDELKEKKEEKAEHKEYLKRAPDDEKLEPIFDKIRDAEEELQQLRKKIGKNDEEIGSLEFKYEEEKRELEKLIEKFEDIQKEKRNFNLAEKSKLALKSYHESLAVKRLQDLCNELVNCFNQICEKDQLLSDAEIDIDTFEVKLTDQNGETVTVNDLSMGESQIYGISLLWALRNISGYNLPLLIDTPIARLDKTHRSNFIHEYLPDVSEQVLLFATTAEMEGDVQSEFEPNMAHLYELNFNEDVGSTVVKGSGHQKNEAEESKIEA